MRELTFGYSPCPNDTFAFHALTHGLSGLWLQRVESSGRYQ